MDASKDRDKKDFFDKLASLSGVFIAIAGFMATYIYNNNQIKLQETKTKADIQAGQINLLERCMKYVTSEDPKEREFGYAVFVINGYQDLALKLIDVKKDAAGIAVIESIASKESDQYSEEAKSVLSRLSANPEQKIKQITNYFETGDINKSFSGFTTPAIDTVIYRSTTGMANMLGIRSTLGIAALYDSNVNLGQHLTTKAIEHANNKLKGTPASGVNESAWLKEFLMYREDWTINHPRKIVRPAAKRARFFLDQLAANNLGLDNIGK